MCGREIQDQVLAKLEAAGGEAGIESDQFGMNIGFDWGASLYMGQLVPGGRLDVPARRFGERMRPDRRGRGGGDRFLASKQLIEQLSESHATQLGIDLDHLLYKPISEMDNVSEKAIRDAGLIPVTKLA